MQREKLISTQGILGGLHPRKIYRDLKAYLQSLTPEELETLAIVKNVKFYLIRISLKNGEKQL
jgi:hypothetical protein